MITTEELKEILDSIEHRDTIAYGMKMRALLEPASSFLWQDPRTANGVPILARRKISATDMNVRVHVPFDKMIASNKAGYFASDIQVVFGESISDNVKTFYKSLKEKANWKKTMLTLANNCVSQGTSYLLCYMDNSELNFTISPTENTYVYYDPLTGKPLYGIRYNNKVAEVYDGMTITRFEKSDKAWVQGTTDFHGLGTIERPMVPIIEFRNSPDSIGNPERTIALADSYDLSLSDLSNELAAIRLSYLLLKGLGEKADKVKQDLVDAGVIIIDSDNGDAKFVTKNINPEAVRLLQETTRALVFEGASSYDPTAFSEGASPTAYEVSQRLHALEMDTNITTGEWDAGFRQLDYLIQTYLMVFFSETEYPLWEVDRMYRRTAPRNMLQALVEAQNAGILLSNETKIELSGLQIDLANETARISEERDSFPNKIEEPVIPSVDG